LCGNTLFSFNIVLFRITFRIGIGIIFGDRALKDREKELMS